MISLYLEIPKKFVCLILLNIFWFVHIPRVRMVRFKLLAQFSVGHLPYPVVSILMLFCVNLQYSLFI